MKTKTVKPLKQPEIQVDELTLRNQEVERAYNQIVLSARNLLTVFESPKYRTWVEVNHSKSEKETTLIKEFICYLWNLTLATNKVGHYVLYFGFDQEGLNKFGSRIFNRMLRSVYKHTMTEATEMDIEDCIRVNESATDVHQFFIRRMLNGENEIVSILVEERLTA